MVYLRGLENCLALTPQPSATRTLAPSFQWLVGKCVELHHQYFLRVTARSVGNERGPVRMLFSGTQSAFRTLSKPN